MKSVLLIDFGSTFTKVCAADADLAELLGAAQSPTTVSEDISIGLDRALDELNKQTGISAYDETFACSSAAGGLKLIASGLVPSLTAEAARRAALGAGAKVIRTFAYELTEDDISELDALKPDIMLLCGGTDGGNAECALKNARAVAGARADFPVVVACNRAIARECERALKQAGREAIVCENVMPGFGKLNIEPAQRVIRDLFLKRIVFAKGLSRVQAILGEIAMPTPAAVLDALKLFAKHAGELMAVDLGGATTDVYSIADGQPTRGGTIMCGLPEPYAKRTVEGDIGMRFSATGVVEAAGLKRVCALADASEAQAESWISAVRAAPETLPQTPAEALIDGALATLAIETGLARHAGEIETVYTPMGAVNQQTGKDLTQIKTLVLTGGALTRVNGAENLARAAMRSNAYPNSLMPRHANILLDKHYILSAMGLLARKHPDAALALMRKGLLNRKEFE